jgi:tetratricopeptide (TPR) repeat protein/S1-C subfamily serine protease
MYRSTWFLTAALVGMNVALVQPAVMAAKSAEQVKSIARGVTVEIRLQQDSSVGSGIIIARQGDLYTIATNRHVVCGTTQKRRDKLPAGETYELGLADGQKYRVTAASIKLIGTELDLAVVQFKSSRKYPVAKLGTASALKIDNVVYTAGFPAEQPGFSFNRGKAIAVVDKRITGDRGGYSLIYDAETAPGMSGGGVFDQNGLLIAIHGQGDRLKANTEIDNDLSQIGSKIGLNRGIPIRWLTQNLADLKINLAGRTRANFRVARAQTSVSADEYFIAGFNKFVEPGDDVMSGKRAAIGELSKAIQINPQYLFAYLIRAYTYEQLQEFQQSKTDYDRVIAFNPRIAPIYTNRANVKFKLNDVPGALSDFDRAIAIDPQNANAYYNRGFLKVDKLNDNRGALSDYNQAISLNPQFTKAYTYRAVVKFKLNDVPGALSDFDRVIALDPQNTKAYIIRGGLKSKNLNDFQGALTDFNQAIAIDPKSANAYYLRGLVKYANLNDFQGALTDFNQAIVIAPQDADLYLSRGNLKAVKLNDIQGASLDFNKAITVNPKNALAYVNRANLKLTKLNDKEGSIQDLRQAAKLFRAEGQTQYLQKVVDLLAKLGAKE